MPTRSLFLLGVLALSALTACNKDAPAPAPTTSTAATPPPVATVAAKPAPPAAPAKPALEDAPNKAMGYSIKLPHEAIAKGTADKNGGSYSFGTMVILVGPTGFPTKTPENLLAAVNTTGGTIEKKVVGDSVVAIVTKPASPVGVYAGPKGKKIMATCLAEPSQKELAIEICSSLTALK